MTSRSTPSRGKKYTLGRGTVEFRRANCLSSVDCCLDDAMYVSRSLFRVASSFGFGKGINGFRRAALGEDKKLADRVSVPDRLRTDSEYEVARVDLESAVWVDGTVDLDLDLETTLSASSNAHSVAKGVSIFLVTVSSSELLVDVEVNNLASFVLKHDRICRKTPSMGIMYAWSTGPPATTWPYTLLVI